MNDNALQTPDQCSSSVQKPHDVIRVGILGGAGYTAGELIRLLLNHPHVEIVFVHSESNAGNRLDQIHEGIAGETDMYFTSAMPFEQVDVLFFCFGHGKSEAFLREHDVPADVRIIDLAQDFRLKVSQPMLGMKLTTDAHDFVYGLPELNRQQIAIARHVANPGCFATCIQLGLLPAARLGIIESNVSVNAITGSTGAGQRPTATTHFSWRTGNMSIYKPFSHQHVPEIRQSLIQLQGSLQADIDFIPYRGDFSRGIFATEVLHTERPLAEIETAYRGFYRDEPFTHYVDRSVDLKQVVNTNKCLVHVEKYGDKLLITSVIDNLLKGAVGQAVENMNIMFGLDERAGLRLKASAF